MLVEELFLENIRCFRELSLKFGQGGEHKKWITFLGENGGGKSTALQALALLLAGPEGAQQLLPRPHGWVRNQEKPGRIRIRIQQGEADPGQYGTEARSFGYSYFMTDHS